MMNAPVDSVNLISGNRLQYKVSADGYEPINNCESPVIFTDPDGTGYVAPAAPVKRLQEILITTLNINECNY